MDFVPSRETAVRPACRLFAGFVFCSAFLYSALGTASAAHSSTSPSARKALQVYFVDVEGGQATLFVTPTGESLLIDTGWPGNEGRDAERIVKAAKEAGIRKIDFVLITHFHNDHVGGASQLAARIPIKTFIDHGENSESSDQPTVQVWQAYQKLLSSRKYKRIVAKPGMVLPIHGMRTEVISSDAALISIPLPGAGQDNPDCQNADRFPVDQTENLRSLGTLITFGKLRILDLGDLTRDQEMKLMCPKNKIGRVDVYIVSHHGWYQSGSPAFINGIAPRVAIMDNGAKKGGTPSAWDILEKAPGLEDLWQLHYSDQGGAQHNVATEFIANPEGPDSGHYLKLTAWEDGKIEVFNSRTEKTKAYAPLNSGQN
jgi:beta-lactamase superfamily II metal-dependent hydrolase